MIRQSQARPNHTIVLSQSVKETSTKEEALLRLNKLDLTMKVSRGSQFWSLEDDFLPIYESFHILSYFSTSCKLIFEERINDKKTNGLNYDIFHIKENQKSGLNRYLIIQTKKDIFGGKLPSGQASLSIQYELYQVDPNNKYNVEKEKLLSNITVKVRTSNQTSKQKYFLTLRKNSGKPEQVLGQSREIIIFDIYDSKDWIQNTLSSVQTQNKRISSFNKSMINEIEYFYLEPNNIRTKSFPEEHISLALQGGGCKGVLYIGAYMAIKQENKPIKSVIGSSAGGILGLAITCQLSIQAIIEVCQTKLSKITDDQKYKTVAQDNQNIMQKTFDDIFSFLKDFNIFSDDILKTLKEFLKDKATQKLFLELIKVATNPEVYKLFVDHSVPGKLNLVGLLYGTLMTGNKMAEISVDFLTTFLNNKKEQEVFKEMFPKIISQEDIKKKAQELNMKEFYRLSGIQFTCTSVDVDDHILRFFNHKTTPNLPVCRAVQMTGSFPVAFEAQRWKPQWGKYYIHYINYRKEVDISGHRFTDGGTLSNFPVKYLDNEDMRPMYFSHSKTNKTYMYGIGITTDIPEDLNKEKQKAKIIGELSTLFQSKVSKFKAGWDWLWGKISKPSTKEIKVTEDMFKRISGIPLVNFLLKLLETYAKTKDNLTEECFSHQCFETYVNSSYLKQIDENFSPEQLKDKGKEVYKKLKENLVEVEKGKQHEKLIERLDSIISVGMEDLCVEHNLYDLGQLVKTNIYNFFYLLLLNVGDQDAKKQITNMILEKMGKNFGKNVESKEIFKKIHELFLWINKEKILVLSKIFENASLIKILASSFKDFCLQLNSHNRLRNFYIKALGEAREIENKYINELLLELSKYQEAEAYVCKKDAIEMLWFKIPNSLRIDEEDEHYRTIKQNNLMFLWFQIPKVTLFLPIKSIKKSTKAIQESDIPQFFIQFESLFQKESIKSYTSTKISEFSNQEKRNCIHLVFQSVPLSELYFHYYYKVVKQYLIDYNLEKDESSKINVQTITSTGIHSLASFLHASDLSDRLIDQYVWQIKQLVKFDKKSLQTKIKNQDWLKTTPIIIKQAQAQATSKRKDIFMMVQENIKQLRQAKKGLFSQAQDQIYRSIEAVNITDDEMRYAIEDSLNFVVSQIMELKKQDIDDEKKLSQLVQNLLLNNSPQKAFDNYKKSSQGLKNVFIFFYEKYKDLLQFLVYQSPFVVDQIVSLLNPEQRKQAWKGILISELLQGENIKSFVQSIMQRLQLHPDTTLMQFYSYSSKKIQLNFSVTQGNLVSILNHVTRPHMPVWAAILAASSTPIFFAPVIDRSEWRSKISLEYQSRKVVSYFEETQNPYSKIYSSQNLTRMPLDLLQNNKFRSEITDEKKRQEYNQVFLVFNFSSITYPNIPESIGLKKIKITQLTLGEIVEKFVSFASIIFRSQLDVQQNRNVKGLKNFGTLPAIESKKNLLSLYVDSNDNLIKKLYKRQLAIMPIRLNTLDFHLMVKPNKETGKDELSTICQDSIMQAYYIIKQKLGNQYSVKLTSVGNNKEGEYKKENSYLGAEYFNKSQQEKRFIILRFENVQMQKKALEDYKKRFIMQQNLEVAPGPLKKNNKLKMRILSFLNPCRQIYEQYFVYYRDPRKQSELHYIRVNQQSLIIDEEMFSKLSLKIQFSNQDSFGNVVVKSSYFDLDLRALFNSSFQVSLDSQNKPEDNIKNFGYNYQLELNFLYSVFKESLKMGQNPQNQTPKLKMPEDPKNQKYLKYLDYLNPNDKSVIEIGIKSDIKQTYLENIFCPDCVYPYTILQDNSGFIGHEKRIQCKNCMKIFALRDKYRILFDSGKNILVSSFGSEIKYNKTKGKVLIACDMCGKTNFNNYFSDEEYPIKFCGDCRMNFAWN